MPCVYRDSTAIPPQTAKLLVEVVRLLNSMPGDDAVRALQQLRGESDARVILSVLRGGIDITQRPSELSTTTAVMDNGLQSIELANYFPIAYPRLPRISIESLRAGLYNELTRPSPGVSPSRRSVLCMCPTSTYAMH